MKLLIRLSFVLIVSNCFSQEIIFEWNKTFGSSGYSYGMTIQTDTHGYLYAAGMFDKSINIDGRTLSSQGELDGFLVKFSTTSNFVWKKHFTSIYNVKITSLAVDSENNLYILGDYENNVHFDTILLTNNTDKYYSSNMFISKFDPGGKLIWAKNTSGVAYNGNSIYIDNMDFILITGKCASIEFFDTTSVVTTLDSIWQWSPNGGYWEYYHSTVGFIAKYDKNGNKIWIKQTGGDPQEIITDNQHNIIITGSYWGDTAYFDSTLAKTTGNETTFLAHYSSSGNLNWIRTSGGSSNWNIGKGLTVDTSNNIYQTGQMSGNDIEFGGNIISEFENTPAFLAKYDQEGNVIWINQIGLAYNMGGNNLFNCANSITIDRNNEIVLTGYFKGVIPYGTSSLISYHGVDLMLLRFDPDRIIIDAGQYSDHRQIRGNEITLGQNNEIYLIGDIIDDGIWYPFIGKVNAKIPTYPLNNMTLNSKEFSLYPNPTTRTIHIDFADKLVDERSVAIYAMDGRKIQEFVTKESKISIDINTKGVFLLVISYDKSLISKRIIVF